ncbi:MAG: hypothetical protein WKF81_03610 [Thermomicrobiales bacterium]
MKKFSDFVRSVNETLNEAIEQQQAQQMGRPMVRPTSLNEAGRVGSNTGVDSQRRPARSTVAIDSSSDLTAEERTQRRPRPTAAPSVARRQPTTGAQLRAALRNPVSFRTAVLVREVLDAPVSKKARRF